MIRKFNKPWKHLICTLVLGVFVNPCPLLAESTSSDQAVASVRFLRKLPLVDSAQPKSTLRMLPLSGQKPYDARLILLPPVTDAEPADLPLCSVAGYVEIEGNNLPKMTEGSAKRITAFPMPPRKLFPVPRVALVPPAKITAGSGATEKLPDPEAKPFVFETLDTESKDLQNPAKVENLLLPSGLADIPLEQNGGGILTIAEAIRLGLENNKGVVVQSFEPKLNAAEVNAQRAPFDPVIGANAYGGQSDVQVRSQIASFGSLSDFLETDFLRPFQRPDNLYYKRKLYSGGEFKLGFATDYANFFPEGSDLIVNPGWDSALNFRFDQPLFRGRGPEVTTARIRIAAAQQTKSRFEFMAEVRSLTRDVELAYWEFAGAQRSVKALTQVVERTQKILERQKKLKKMGGSAKPEVLLAENLLAEVQILQYEEMQRRDVAESELRQVMGVQAVGDPCYGTASSHTGLFSEHFSAVADRGASDPELPAEASTQRAIQRPEMLAQCAAIQAAQINVRRAKNGLLPNVSARFDYSVRGLEKNLDESIHTIGDHDYKTWAVGLIYEQALGKRAQKVDFCRAKLILARESRKRDLIRHDILHSLRRAEENVLATKRQLDLHQKRILSAREQAKAFDTLYNEKKDRVGFQMRLVVERNLALAESEAAIAWTKLQLARATRNYEANFVSPAIHIEVAPAPGSVPEPPRS